MASFRMEIFSGYDKSCVYIRIMIKIVVDCYFVLSKMAIVDVERMVVRGALVIMARPARFYRTNYRKK